MAGHQLEEADITKEAMKEYEDLIVHTHLPVRKNTKGEKDENFAWGVHNGNLLITNPPTARRGSRLGTTITEHWMLFPDEIESSIREKLFALTDQEKLFGVKYSLHSFTDLCITLEYRNPEAYEKTQALYSNGQLKDSVVAGLKNAGYDCDVDVTYFDSVIKSDVKD